ncbi:hypothetical protein [Actinocorallia libanotica]|uniref:SUKH-4 immunity protein of toxin-antitoxin system n=1 Tax=Actinocorallia libanotica TaxID=46162 RepID=A0ABN1RCL7_9ACTN
MPPLREHEDRFLGEFSELPYGRPEGPSLRAAVRDRGEDDEDLLVRYLRSGAVLVASPSRTRDVLSPTGEVIGGFAVLTDGFWVWYSDLPHYVERYHVELDPRFVSDVRTRRGAVPSLSEAELMDLAQAVFGLPTEPDAVDHT